MRWTAGLGGGVAYHSLKGFPLGCIHKGLSYLLGNLHLSLSCAGTQMRGGHYQLVLHKLSREKRGRENYDCSE